MTEATDPSAAPQQAPRRRPWWTALLAGILAGLLLAVALALPLAYYAYHTGKERGRQAEKERLFRVAESLVVPEQESTATDALARGQEALRRSSSAPTAALERGDPAAAPGAWCFTANECVRAVWPMELLPASPAVGHPHFRVREGANRLCGRDNGLCEFVFRTDDYANVIVYVHARYTDDCGNSLRCYIDGGAMTRVGDRKEYDRWLWDHSMRRFQVRPGTHRLTVQTSEDGMEFDRVAVSGRPLLDAELERLPVTAPPLFENLPPAAPNLPAIGAVTAQMFASESLVIGRGHRNALTVFLRLNGSEAVSGQVELQSPRGGCFELRDFRLTPEKRTQLLAWELRLSPRTGYFVPLQMRVLLPGGCAYQQSLHFIRPLPWAFLGPIPDPEGKGLDFVPPAERLVASFAALPPVGGLEWNVVDDGSCYDEFGVVDLNKVFGRPNERWREDAENRPEVAYAVTALYIPAPDVHHMPLVLAGDDCVQAWHNGKLVVRQDGNAPIETSRLVVGVDMVLGQNVFAFKVPQTRLRWQLLFEPETTLPYSLGELFQPLPIRAWRSK